MVELPSGTVTLLFTEHRREVDKTMRALSEYMVELADARRPAAVPSEIENVRVIVTWALASSECAAAGSRGTVVSAKR
jgi:hypothetical protein